MRTSLSIAGLLAFGLWAAPPVQAQPAAPADAAKAAAPAGAAPGDQGEYLARLANCVACHSVPGGKAFTGGLKMMTPLGAIYATNITPDPETGIGAYSLADFDRAVRKGVAKDGHRLYPAMPYPSYAKLTDDDVKALYDYFMKSVPAAKQANLPSEIPFPLNMRWPLALWNVLFFDDAPYKAKAAHDAAWNRGAYIVQGLGHCGACHTPRGIAFNEKGYDEASPLFLSGAPLDNWSAPNLTQASNTGLGRWTVQDIVAFMKTGRNQFGNAYGTMTEVINNSSQYMTEEDHLAVATYVKSLPAQRETIAKPYAYDGKTAADLHAGKLDAAGALTYLQSCRSCHGADGKGYPPYLPPLAGNPSVLDSDASSLINITLNGSARIVVQGMPDSYRMPQFRVMLTDQKIADVVNFMRAGWGNAAAPVTAAQVAKIRAETNPASDRIEVLRMK
jgi:mono/diheme cytochrome c family protein